MHHISLKTFFFIYKNKKRFLYLYFQNHRVYKVSEKNLALTWLTALADWAQSSGPSLLRRSRRWEMGLCIEPSIIRFTFGSFSTPPLPSSAINRGGLQKGLGESPKKWTVLESGALLRWPASGHQKNIRKEGGKELYLFAHSRGKHYIIRETASDGTNPMTIEGLNVSVPNKWVSPGLLKNGWGQVTEPIYSFIQSSDPLSSRVAPKTKAQEGNSNVPQDDI